MVGAQKLLSELPDKDRKIGSIDGLLGESARRVQLSNNQAVGDCIRRIALEDLVLSQEDKPKRYRSAREILHETAILRSSVQRIFHCNL